MASWLSIGPYEAPADGIGNAAVGVVFFLCDGSEPRQNYGGGMELWP